MINSILIANRGEIASRVIRTCRKMGIRSVAVFSDADRDALFVQEADTAIHLGESNPQTSYLNQEKLLAVCAQHQVDAVHPGYGFLSENAEFARKCQAAGVIFIGPRAEAIEAMGSKSNAKTIMKQNEVPVIPGYQGADQSTETLSQAAHDIGFPVLLKATAGGGGKGMRIVHTAKELNGAIDAAKREAQNAFGNDELIIEKYIASGRHIEFQILGDQHGKVVHILERECTIQRRYQKVIEESPSPVLTPELRQKMGEAALKAAQALNYDNAGTVEFIFDDQSQQFYFLEVNTRLQVEHPVTEEITGLDLVQLQIEIAEGHPLALNQADIQANGYAVECRLYAEDAANDFLPVTGTIQQWSVPNVEGLRVETAIQSGAEISMHYDPMIAKLIVWDAQRTTAHRKMKYVLRHLQCLGITTNQDFLIQLFDHPHITQGKYDTHFLVNEFNLKPSGGMQGSLETKAGMAATLYNWQQRQHQRALLRGVPSGWRSNFYAHQKEVYTLETTRDGKKHSEEIVIKYRYLNHQQFEFIVGNTTEQVKLVEAANNQVCFEASGIRYIFYLAKSQQTYYLRNEHLGGATLKLQDRLPQKEAEKVKGGYEAPMPSQIIKVLVAQGQEVKSGDGLIVLSSMKMENTIAADEDGTVAEIYTEEGASVEARFLLVKVD
ncbi:acetyl/propionyl/methylcrotonyl-CoA carboxylase subunit alpha [Microscilla marina]|uniref:Methylcrotonoyl-CoA carboxylase alpha chain n=1 Tax=Microscilla marina ATCC 23134 TaxID=313606 RepID=A1ZZI3_MICM2|nr:acetyl-CoA carboxylase biotin carboxylase subunit [Microscilla marina]EAY24229.1 methylcrotonoyl-CoA carboxylase alpha chain [Microscilla marina ATCC 23134]